MIIGSSGNIALLPVAFVSHFALDVLPHYANDNLTKNLAAFHRNLIIDCLIAGCLLLAVLVGQTSHSLTMVAGGILSASPDLMWIRRWLSLKAGKKHNYDTFMEKWHHRIQWAESRPAAIFEILWFVICLWVLISLGVKFF